MQVEVLHNQSLLDVALQSSGLLSSIVEIAKVNSISIDEDLPPGKYLIFPDPLEADADILQYFKVKNVKPATEITQTHIRYNEGIDFWEIGENFEIQ